MGLKVRSGAPNRRVPLGMSQSLLGPTFAHLQNASNDKPYRWWWGLNAPRKYRIPSHDHYYHFLNLQPIYILKLRAPYYSEYFHVFKNFQHCFLFKFVDPSVTTFGQLWEHSLMHCSCLTLLRQHELWRLRVGTGARALLATAYSRSAHATIAFVPELRICILLNRHEFL